MYSKYANNIVRKILIHTHFSITVCKHLNATINFKFTVVYFFFYILNNIKSTSVFKFL